MYFPKLTRFLGVAILFGLLTGPLAHAETLMERMEALEVLPVPYGAMTLKVNHKDVLIIRGEFETGTAWGGDIYTVLEREMGLASGKETDKWQIARHEKSDWNSVLTITRPHTDQDSIEAAHFMIPKGERSSDVSALYLLEAHREYVPDEASQTTLKLSVLRHDEDFSMLQFHEAARIKTEEKYCNVDWAMYKELNVPLPDNSGQYDCGDR